LTRADKLRLAPRVGECFEIALTEPGATGYLYEPKFDPKLVSFEGVDRNISSKVGGSSSSVFRFRAKAAGEGQITFQLIAPWDPEPADKRIVLLEVRK
jgi:Chagasin family peptidase inhibitor I42